MIDIDGSQGEGGGQILRTSLSLSLVTGRSVHLYNIRANRPRPGLSHQHVAAVRAAAEISGAALRGAEKGSRELFFEPGPVQAGPYRFAVGSAGSATLVLQTVLPALLTAGAPSRLRLEGGTHNPWAPPFEFLERAFLPQVERMGPRLRLRLERPGFHPAGGGRMEADIEPAQELKGFELLERDLSPRLRARAYVSDLPRHIAERELGTLQKDLDLEDRHSDVVEVPDPAGPGNAVMVFLESSATTEVVTAFGRKGKRAEDVAREAARAAKALLRNDVPVGEYLADQILLPLALAGKGGFCTGPLSSHTRTNIDVIRRFLDTPVRVEEGDEIAVIRIG